MPRKSNNNGAESGSFHLSGLLEDAWGRYRRASKRAKSKITEESVHDLRVSLRRLEAAMDLIRPLADDPMQKARKKLERFFSSLNRLRDVHVQLLAVNNLIDAYPDIRVFQKKLLKKALSLSQAFKEKLSDRRRKLKNSFDSALENSRTMLDEVPATEMRRIVVESAHDAFAALTDALRALDPLEIASIHRIRVALKKFRYMIQAAQPVLRDTPEPTLQNMHELQTMLGSVHDADMLLEALKSWGKKQKQKKRRALEPAYEFLADRRRGAIDEALKRVHEIHTFWQLRDKKLNSAIRPGA
jgi:CHAD domain-containing protein